MDPKGFRRAQYEYENKEEMEYRDIENDLLCKADEMMDGEQDR